MHYLVGSLFLTHVKQSSNYYGNNWEKLHFTQILSLREEHESKELNLKAKYDQELRQSQIQAENELKEVPTDINS